MIHSLLLLVGLFGVWLLWSGHLEPLTLAFGVVSCFLVVLLGLRMRIVDKEGQPFYVTFRFLLYLPWLIKEIVLANLSVTRMIMHPRMPIDPAIVEFEPSQKTDLGQVIVANSITLTPGTLSVTAEGGKITVHAIDREMVKVVQTQTIRRVRRLEGES